MTAKNVIVLFLLVCLSTLPNLSAANSCSTAEKDAIGLCTIINMKEWKVTSAEMGSTSRNFCCFIWNALECQVKIAKMCDWEYAEKLSRETEKAYRSICAIYPRRSSKCVRNSRT